MKKIIIFVLSMFLFCSNTYASSCTNQELIDLNSIAGNVAMSYEIATEYKTYDDGVVAYKKFVISITNITEDIYVVIKNDYNSDTYTFSSSDADENGIVTFDWSHRDAVTEFTMYIYSSSNTNCPTEKLRTLYLVTPMYNAYSTSEICEELTDFSYCQEYVTFDIADADVFYSKLASYQAEREAKEVEDTDEDDSIFDIIINFLDTYKWYILGGVAIILVIAGGIYVVYLIRTKKQRELGLR